MCGEDEDIAHRFGLPSGAVTATPLTLSKRRSRK